MTIAQDLETLQHEPKLEDIEYPPGDLESQEPPLESYFTSTTTLAVNDLFGLAVERQK